MEISERAFSVQHTMSILIFVIVSILVLGGLALSYYQFRLDAHASSRKNDSPDAPKANLKVGEGGIEFSSSVIGLVVLFMSLLFFYLYVNNVYKITPHEIDPISFPSRAEDPDAKREGNGQN